MKINLIITRKVLTEKLSIKNKQEALFLSFLDGCEIKLSERYTNSIFYVKNDKVLFEQKLKSKYFYVTHDLIWSIFKYKYQMEYKQIQSFIKGMLETHLKLEGYTPDWLIDCNVQQLETHLKLEGYTP